MTGDRFPSHRTRRRLHNKGRSPAPGNAAVDGGKVDDEAGDGQSREARRRRAAAGSTAGSQRAEFASPFQGEVLRERLSLTERVGPRLVDVADLVKEDMVQVVPPNLFRLPDEPPAAPI